MHNFNFKCQFNPGDLFQAQKFNNASVESVNETKFSEGLPLWFQ